VVVAGIAVWRREAQDPDVDPLLEPDGGAPDGAPEPDGGVPDPEPDPLPMFGQFFVEPDPELELDPELEPEPEPAEELDEPVPVLPEPELFVFELDEGVLVELELVPLPELPVAADVVAALATSAPPATRPDASAPTARTLRMRICIVVCPFVCEAPVHSTRHCTRCTSDLSAAAQRRGRVTGVTRRTRDDSQQATETVHRWHDEDVQVTCRPLTEQECGTAPPGGRLRPSSLSSSRSASGRRWCRARRIPRVHRESQPWPRDAYGAWLHPW
jgi:hypothetical protein